MPDRECRCDFSRKFGFALYLPYGRADLAGEVENKESGLLQSAYQTCLSLAEKHECRTLAFPSISTGVYRYPVDLAAEVALRTVAVKLEASDQLELVRFVLFDQGTFGGYARVLETMLV